MDTHQIDFLQTSGSSLFPDWFPKWQVELALQHNAIVVLPNYRLLPDSSGMDIMDDIDDLWTWVTFKLADTLRDNTNGVEPDLSRILTAGESAGKFTLLCLNTQFENNS